MLEYKFVGMLGRGRTKGFPNTVFTGLTERRRKVTGEFLKEMRELRKAGVPKKEIAERLNLSYEAVFRYLREEGFFKWVKRKMGLRQWKPVHPLMF